MSNAARTGLVLVVLIAVIIVGVIAYMNSDSGSPENALTNGEQLLNGDRTSFGLSNTNDTSIRALKSDMAVIDAELERFDEDTEAAEDALD